MILSLGSQRLRSWDRQYQDQTKGHSTKCEECSEMLGSFGDLDVHKGKFHESNLNNEWCTKSNHPEGGKFWKDNLFKERAKQSR